MGLGLGELFSWVPQLITWLLGWIPHMGRVHAHEGGVKISGPAVAELTAGMRVWRLLPRGVFFWVPHFSGVWLDNIKRKVVELPEQLLTTGDGKRVRAGGILVYHITNLTTWLVENEDPEHGVQVEAARVFREWVKTLTFEQVQAFRPAKRGEDDLTRMAQAEMGADFGVRVRQLSLASFARSSAVDLHHGGGLTPKGGPQTILHID